MAVALYMVVLRLLYGLCVGHVCWHAVMAVASKTLTSVLRSEQCGWTYHPAGPRRRTPQGGGVAV